MCSSDLCHPIGAKLLGYLFVMARKGEQEESGEIKDLPVWKCILFMVLGGIMVVMGSDFAVDGASAIARVFGMSERCQNCVSTN